MTDWVNDWLCLPAWNVGFTVMHLRQMCATAAAAAAAVLSTTWVIFCCCRFTASFSWWLLTGSRPPSPAFPATPFFYWKHTFQWCVWCSIKVKRERVEISADANSSNWCCYYHFTPFQRALCVNYGLFNLCSLPLSHTAAETLQIYLKALLLKNWRINRFEHEK